MKKPTYAMDPVVLESALELEMRTIHWHCNAISTDFIILVDLARVWTLTEAEIYLLAYLPVCGNDEAMKLNTFS